MSTIFNVLKKAFTIALNKNTIKKNPEIQTISEKSEYTNIRYLPISTKI